MNDFQDVLYRVAAELGVSPLAVLSTDRHDPLPLARMVIAWIMAHRFWSSSETIGDLLGRDESTVRYYIRQVSVLRRTNQLPENVATILREPTTILHNA